MKIRNLPQTGACGDIVVSRNHHGAHQRRRPVRTKPRNKPHTPAIDRSENVWSALAALWNTLTEEQYRAWDLAASYQRSRSRNGETSRLTGRDYFFRVNSSRASLNLEPLLWPPDQADYCNNPVKRLVLTRRAGRVTLALELSERLSATIKLYASPPQPRGRRRCWDLRVLGALSPTKRRVIDITPLYAKRFGAPRAGTRVFVRAVVHVNGQQSLPKELNGVVPD